MGGVGSGWFGVDQGLDGLDGLGCLGIGQGDTQGLRLHLGLVVIITPEASTFIACLLVIPCSFVAPRLRASVTAKCIVCYCVCSKRNRDNYSVGLPLRADTNVLSRGPIREEKGL